MACAFAGSAAVAGGLRARGRRTRRGEQTHIYRKPFFRLSVQGVLPRALRSERRRACLPLRGAAHSRYGLRRAGDRFAERDRGVHPVAAARLQRQCACVARPAGVHLPAPAELQRQRADDARHRAAGDAGDARLRWKPASRPAAARRRIARLRVVRRERSADTRCQPLRARDGSGGRSRQLPPGRAVRGGVAADLRFAVRRPDGRRAPLCIPVRDFGTPFFVSSGAAFRTRRFGRLRITLSRTAASDKNGRDRLIQRAGPFRFPTEMELRSMLRPSPAPPALRRSEDGTR